MNIIKKNRIDQLCIKHNSWKQLFLSWLESNDNLNIDDLEKSFLHYLKYKHLLKKEITPNSEKNLLKLSIDSSTSVTVLFDDKIKSTLHKENKEQFIKSLKTNKYKYLFNSEVEGKINNILDTNISHQALKSQLFSKIIKYKSAVDFLKDLNEYQIQNKNWNKKYIINKIKDHSSIQIIEEKDNSLMVQVYGFDGAKHIGSLAWCVAQDRGSFDAYADSFKRQFVYFDFSLPIDDDSSLIGLTVNCQGSITESFLKNNNPLDSSYYFKFNFDQHSIKEITSHIINLTNDNIALSLVCEHELEDLLNTYLDKSDIDVTSAFCIALRSANVTIIDMFLKHPKSKDIVFNDYMVKLSFKYNFKSVLEFLNINQNAEYNHQNGMSVWLNLIKKEKFNISILSQEDNKLILKLNNLKDFEILTYIKECCVRFNSYEYNSNGHFSSYILYLDFNKEITDKESMMLLIANFNGRVEGINANNDKIGLKSKKIKKKLTKKYLDLIKVDWNKKDIEKEILKLPEISDQLHFICKYNMEELFFEFIEKGRFKSVFKDKYSKKDVWLAFSWAVSHSSVDMVSALINSVNIKTLTKYNNKALYTSYRYKKHDNLKLLLENKDFCEKITVKSINKYVKEKDKQMFVDKMVYHINKI
jgi:hypothetical protein